MSIETDIPTRPDLDPEAKFKLRDFQEEDVVSMYHRTGFLLANDMGTGKTVTALAEIARRYEDRDTMRVLIVTLKSAISVWEYHTPYFLDLPVYTREVPKKVANWVTVTNWDQLRVNPDYKKVVWTYVIADEAQNAKNRNAKRTRALWTVPTMYRRALTGTPIVNRPDDLWAILRWLYPERYRSYWQFFNTYVDFETNPFHGYREIKGAKNVKKLQKEIGEFTVRRLKKDVLKELPDKYYERIEVDLNPTQRRVYNQMKQDALAWIGEHEDKPLPAKMVVAKLVRLRQITGATPIDAYQEYDKNKDTMVWKVTMGEPSAKLDALMDILQSTDQQVVVFTNFRSAVRLASARMTKAGITHVTLTGTTPDKERTKAIDDFQNGRARVFIGTVKAGGAGITLHAASTVVFLDRSWSPADNVQAEDRLHRIGQKNAVQVIHIEARNTVDQLVEAKLVWKWSFIKQILGG